MCCLEESGRFTTSNRNFQVLSLVHNRPRWTKPFGGQAFNGSRIKTSLPIACLQQSLWREHLCGKCTAGLLPPCLGKGHRGVSVASGAPAEVCRSILSKAPLFDGSGREDSHYLVPGAPDHSFDRTADCWFCKSDFGIAFCIGEQPLGSQARVDRKAQTTS